MWLKGRFVYAQCAIFDSQIDLTAVIGSFFPELEALIAWLYRGGRKKTNDVIISWCNDVLQTRRKMQLNQGKRRQNWHK